MKNIIALIIFCCAISACKIANKGLGNKAEEKNSPSESPMTAQMVYNEAEQNLAGRWTLYAKDSYGSKTDLEKEPSINPGDVIWNFVTKERGVDSLFIINYLPSSKNPSPLDSGSFQYWQESCLVQIGRERYKYKVFQIKDNKGNVIAHELHLTNNLMLNLPDGGSTMRFRTIDAYWACGVTDEPNTRPQWACTIPEPIRQAYEEEIELDGRWTLSHYSAFTSPDMLPNYKPEEVIWEFGKDGLSKFIQVKKDAPDIKNDYSLADGKYNYWADKCLLQINNTIYYYDLNEIIDEDGKKVILLKLNSGTEPGIADEEQYFSFVKIQ